MYRKGDLGLLYFTATWCVPCKGYKPVVRRLAEELEFFLAEKDIDDNIALAEAYEVLSVPTVIVYNLNDEKERVEELDRLVGAFPEPMLRKRLEALVG